MGGAQGPSFVGTVLCGRACVGSQAGILEVVAAGSKACAVRARAGQPPPEACLRKSRAWSGSWGAAWRCRWTARQGGRRGQECPGARCSSFRGAAPALNQDQAAKATRVPALRGLSGALAEPRLGLAHSKRWHRLACLVEAGSALADDTRCMCFIQGGWMGACGTGAESACAAGAEGGRWAAQSGTAAGCHAWDTAAAAAACSCAAAAAAGCASCCCQDAAAGGCACACCQAAAAGCAAGAGGWPQAAMAICAVGGGAAAVPPCPPSTSSSSDSSEYLGLTVCWRRLMRTTLRRAPPSLAEPAARPACRSSPSPRCRAPGGREAWEWVPQQGRAQQEAAS